MKKTLSLVLVILLLLCACTKQQSTDTIPENDMAGIQVLLAWVAKDETVISDDALRQILTEGSIDVGEPIHVYRASAVNKAYLDRGTPIYPLYHMGEVLALVWMNSEDTFNFFRGGLEKMLPLEGASCAKAVVVANEGYYLYTEEYGFELWWEFEEGVTAHLPPDESYDLSSMTLSNALTENGKTWPLELGK